MGGKGSEGLKVHHVKHKADGGHTSTRITTAWNPDRTKSCTATAPQPPPGKPPGTPAQDGMLEAIAQQGDQR